MLSASNPDEIGASGVWSLELPDRICLLTVCSLAMQVVVEEQQRMYEQVSKWLRYTKAKYLTALCMATERKLKTGAKGLLEVGPETAEQPDSDALNAESLPAAEAPESDRGEGGSALAAAIRKSQRPLGSRTFIKASIRQAGSSGRPRLEMDGLDDILADLRETAPPAASAASTSTASFNAAVQGDRAAIEDAHEDGVGGVWSVLNRLVAEMRTANSPSKRQ